MQLAAVASAFPKYYYPQKTISRKLTEQWGASLGNPEVIARLSSNVKVDGRYLSLPIDEYPSLETWGQKNDAWIRCAEEIGQAAICRALTKAGMDPSAIDALFVVSVTGIASPSLDARLINRMGLNPNIRRVPIFGLGCVAGAAGISRAADYVRAYPDHTACLLAVELCSLTWQKDDLSMANLISAGLFGDGAAAVLVAGEKVGRPGPRVVATQSIFYPDSQEMMGWNISEKGFRIVLSPGVPQLIREHIGDDVRGFLRQHQLAPSDIGCWILHPGGPKVLSATIEGLGLTDDDVALSWECLRKVGNLSSASVLLVLEEVMNRREQAPGTLGLLAAMGPGFCSELVLLEW